MGTDSCDTGYAFQCLFGLSKLLDVVEMDDEAMPENGLVDPLHQGFIVLAHVVFHRFTAGYKIRSADVAYSQDLTADGLGFLFVLDLIVHKGDDLILLLQILDQIVDVQGQERHAAHDDQAGHDDGNRREGHEPMGPDAPEALTDQITSSTHS